MALSTTLYKVTPDADLTAKQLKMCLEIVHDDTPIKLLIGNQLVSVKEFRQISETGQLVTKVLVPVDFVIGSN